MLAESQKEMVQAKHLEGLIPLPPSLDVVPPPRVYDRVCGFHSRINIMRDVIPILK